MDEKLELLEFDELLSKHVGEFGFRQKIYVAILALGWLNSLQVLAPVFTSAAPEHWCRVDDTSLQNCTTKQVIINL